MVHCAFNCSETFPSSLPPCIGPSRASKIVKASSKKCTMVQHLAPFRYTLQALPPATSHTQHQSHLYELLSHDSSKSCISRDSIATCGPVAVKLCALAKGWTAHLLHSLCMRYVGMRHAYADILQHSHRIFGYAAIWLWAAFEPHNFQTRICAHFDA
jgi:hypothetical protein